MPPPGRATIGVRPSIPLVMPAVAGIRVAAPIAGGVQLVGLVLLATVLVILYVVGLLALVVVGIITVVLLHRVNRAGWLAPAPAGPTVAAQE